MMLSSLEITVLICAYMVGALPVGWIIARLSGIRDIRKHGSGNIGATNVSRSLGISYFFLTFFLDAFKAGFFLLLMQYSGATQDIIFLACCVILLGNGYSIFLGGSGGKGVSTTCGLLLVLNFYVGFIVIIFWLVIFCIFKTSAVASLTSMFFLPFITWYVVAIYSYIVLSVYFAFWVWLRHYENIQMYCSLMYDKLSDFIIEG